MHLLMKYFSQFDGSKTWEEIAPVVDATFHEDFVIVDGKTKYNKTEFTAKLRDFVNADGWMEILKLKAEPRKHGIRYEIAFHHPNDAMSPVTMTQSFSQFSPDNGKLLGVKRDNIRNANQIL